MSFRRHTAKTEFKSLFSHKQKLPMRENHNLARGIERAFQHDQQRIHGRVYRYSPKPFPHYVSHIDDSEVIVVIGLGMFDCVKDGNKFTAEFDPHESPLAIEHITQAWTRIKTQRMDVIKRHYSSKRVHFATQNPIVAEASMCAFERGNSRFREFGDSNEQQSYLIHDVFSTIEESTHIATTLRGQSVAYDHVHRYKQ